MTCALCTNQKPVTTGPMTGFVRCAKASVAEYFSPVIERKCVNFVAEAV